MIASLYYEIISVTQHYHFLLYIMLVEERQTKTAPMLGKGSSPSTAHAMQGTWLSSALPLSPGSGKCSGSRFVHAVHCGAKR